MSHAAEILTLIQIDAHHNKGGYIWPYSIRSRMFYVLAYGCILIKIEVLDKGSLFSFPLKVTVGGFLLQINPTRNFL